jgi:hypothetical protein
MRQFDVSQLIDAFGFGVAGNFAGHLEQAGEASDFRSVRSETADAPKGIFPWYAPGDRSFLGTFPVASDVIVLPPSESSLRLQIEPEVGVVCSVGYDDDGRVVALAPTALGAFNDCSIRREGANRISEKKNWGPASKGFARVLFEVSDIDPAGGLRTLRIASFLRRGDVVHEYGVDSPASEYSYCGERLTAWMLDRLANQVASPGTPLEDVGALFRSSGRPERAVIGIGATRYTEFGERNFLDVGDESIVIVYDEVVVGHGDVMFAVANRAEFELAGASVLTQLVRGPEA